MSLTTTAPASADAPTTAPTTVTCDAPGCTVAAPVAESGHLPAGWHTLVRALGAGLDAPQWHFHTPECIVSFLTGVAHAARVAERLSGDALNGLTEAEREIVRQMASTRVPMPVMWEEWLRARGIVTTESTMPQTLEALVNAPPLAASVATPEPAPADAPADAAPESAPDAAPADAEEPAVSASAEAPAAEPAEPSEPAATTEAAEGETQG